MFWTRLGGGEARRRGTGDIASEKREVGWFWDLGLGPVYLPPWII
jgi:hypothetical protein